MKTKKELRQDILQKRDALSLTERREKSRQISKQIIYHPAFLAADKILLFSSFRSEVETGEIFENALRMKKQVYFPKVMGKEMEFYRISDENELIQGYCGILEPECDEAKKFIPKPKDRIFVLMPAAVVDKKGGRIGYGGGYYDKYLQQLEAKIPRENLYKMAVVFACQVIDEGMIPKEEHDVQPDEVVTENQVHFGGLGRDAHFT